MSKVIDLIKAYDSGDMELLDTQIVARHVPASDVARAIGFLEKEAGRGCINSLEALARILDCDPDDCCEEGVLASLRNDELERTTESLNHGSVYVLVNEYMPGLLKIGYTTQPIKERIKQISSATGVPAPYVLLFSFETIQCQEVEMLLHKRLDKYRTNASREFFSCSPVKAIEAFKQIIMALHKRLGISEGGRYLRDTTYFPDIATAEYRAEQLELNPDSIFRPPYSRDQRS